MTTRTRLQTIAATICLYCTMVFSILILACHRSTDPESLGESDAGTIQDVSGQRLYQGHSLDYWSLTLDEDLPAGQARGGLAAAAIPGLLERLKAPQSAISSAMTLMRMGPAARSAVPQLIELVQRGDQPAALLAIKVLQYIGPEAEAAVPALQALVKTGTGNYYRPAMAALGGIGAKARAAIPALSEALEHADDLAQVEAAEALWKIERRPERLLEALLSASQQGSELCRLLAQKLLAEVQAAVALSARVTWPEAGFARQGAYVPGVTSVSSR